MTMRVHRPDSLQWRRMDHIEMGSIRQHMDATELAGDLCFHEPGDDTCPQLMEMRLNPGTLIAPHAHALGEIFYVVTGSLHWGDKVLPAGGSIYIPGETTYSFRTGPEETRLLNLRATTDHSFIPPAG